MRTFEQLQISSTKPRKFLEISPKEYYKMFPPNATAAEIDEAIADVSCENGRLGCLTIFDKEI